MVALQTVLYPITLFFNNHRLIKVIRDFINLNIKASQQVLKHLCPNFTLL